MNIKNENTYLAFMVSELNSESKFFDFKRAHDSFTSDPQNVWSHTDQMLALYALVKKVIDLDDQKHATRAAYWEKLRNVQAQAAKRLG